MIIVMIPIIRCQFLSAPQIVTRRIIVKLTIVGWLCSCEYWPSKYPGYMSPELEKCLYHMAVGPDRTAYEGTDRTEREVVNFIFFQLD